MWKIYSLNPSDNRWGISRTVINSQGFFQLEKYTKIFKSLESAQTQANKLNNVV